MKILRKKNFSKKEEDVKKEKVKGVVVGGTGVVGGGAILSKVKGNRLTGKVVRYHNTPLENVDSILENGIKTSYANDPNSYTRTVVGPGIKDKEKLNNLVYTAKRKFDANVVGASRAFYDGKFNNGVKPNAIDVMFLGNDLDTQRKLLKETVFPKHSKTLKIELDYDTDIKGGKKIRNPELDANRYTQASPRELKALDEGTHIFDHDIDPSKIKGSKHFKRRTLKDVKRYIKNNPKRFGKEVGKLVLGSAAVVGGSGYAYKNLKNKKKDSDKKDRESKKD